MSLPTLEEKLQQLLRRPDYTPQDASGLARMLELDSHERPALRALVKEWEKEGKILRLKQQRYTLKAVADAPLRGRLRSGVKGKLYFRPDADSMAKLRKDMGIVDDGQPLELPVTPNRSLDALPGDTVLVSVRKAIPPHQRRGRRSHPDARDLRPEARVLEIVERKLKQWVGTYRAGGLYGFVQGDGYATPEMIRLSEPAPEGVLAGMCVTVEPERYPLGKMDATGRIVQVLGWPDDAGVDITRIMHRYALRDEFPPAVLAETRKISHTLSDKELAGRDDWRNRCVITIDPIDARDFDDAISVRRRSQGWDLAVHIADVSHYVRPGSATDIEAKERGNSTYLPDRVLPMLPPTLCDDICSLREGEPRLTCLCQLRIGMDGSTEKATFRKAVICSRKRFAYEQVLPILEGTASCGDDEIDTMLREAHLLAQTLRRRRMQRGALNLDMPELHVLLDNDGTPVGIQQNAGDIAHQLIEECMLVANEAVAQALNAKQLPAIHRVHEAPDPAKLTALGHELRSYGLQVGALNTREELCRVAEQVVGHRDELTLKPLILRAMMRARYDAKSLGHFGLNKGNYCHFTSPIRRYADLVVHRAFARLVAHHPAPLPPLPPASALPNLADHISETERNSAFAESEAQQAKLMQYMQIQAESETPAVWQARITEAWLQGLAVELPELRLRGFIPGEALEASGRWYYESHAHRWSCTDGRHLLPGDQLPVVPMHVNVADKFIDFRPAVMSKA
ncbi:MAG: VacB/RNase II family 3'-5' exoribonuclease [Akkermansia sp.]|nr:VacB/RNase II family 3'-5' exoribonuclease [Akkermansia sp.]